MFSLRNEKRNCPKLVFRCSLICCMAYGMVFLENAQLKQYSAREEWYTESGKNKST